MLPSVDPPPPEDPSRCQLLGPTALAVQAAMGVFVIASLVAKRHFEKRKRPWRIWLFDVGKQLVGQAVLHGANLLISGLIAEGRHNSPCSSYFLNILIDTTIGVLILYYALKLSTAVMERYGVEGLKSGYYGDPPQIAMCVLAMDGADDSWWRQLIPYLIAVLIMKILVILPLTLPGISTLLLRFGHAAIEYLSPSLQVVFVMMIFPCIMNVLQATLVDQVIKAGKVEEIEEEGYERVADDVEAYPKTTSTPNSPLLSAVDTYGTHERLERSGAPSPDSNAFASVSRLSQDLQVEARQSLSPKTGSHLARVQSGLSLSNL